MEAAGFEPRTLVLGSLTICALDHSTTEDPPFPLFFTLFVSCHNLQVYLKTLESEIQQCKGICQKLKLKSTFNGEQQTPKLRVCHILPFYLKVDLKKQCSENRTSFFFELAFYFWNVVWIMEIYKPIFRYL